MQFIALIIIALCLLFITYKRPKWGLIAFVGLLFIVGLFFWFTPTDLTHKKASPLTQYAQLSDAQVRVGYADSFVLTARLSNEHATTSIEEVIIRSKLSLCETDSANSCVVLGDETNLLKEFVPAGQARDFSMNLSSRLRAGADGVLNWQHAVIDAR